MRLPAPVVSSDPLMELEGRRVICKVDGQQIRGRLISVRGRPQQTANNLEQIRN